MEQGFLKRIGILLISLVFLAAGIALFIKAQLGSDPYTTFNIGISELTGINFSIVQIIINLILLIGIMIVDKSYIKIGTFIALFSVGPMIEFFGEIYKKLMPGQYNLQIRMMMLLIACLIVSFSVGVYIATDLGAGPYDLLPVIAEKYAKWKFEWTRVILDMSCAAIGFILGVTVGIGTVIAAFGLGPAIAFSRNLAKHYLFKEE